MVDKEEIDCTNTDNIVCPYCGYEEEPDLHWIGNTTNIDDYQCDDCGKNFTLYIDYSVSFSSGKITCKNNAHDYKIDSVYLHQKTFLGRKKTGADSEGWASIPKDKWELTFIYKCSKCDCTDYRREPINETPCFDCTDLKCEKSCICQYFREFCTAKIEELKRKEGNL